MKGVPHYTKGGKLYKGKTHKHPSIGLMSGDKHTASSVKLYHKDEISKLKNMPKKVREKLKKACWKNYEPVGTKIKGGKRVPNCVPKVKKKK